MAVLGVGLMVIVGLLVRTELAPRGRVWTMAGRGSVVLCDWGGAATAGAAAEAPATTERPDTTGCGA